MITSTLAQLHWYKTVSPHFAKAIDYILSTDFLSLAAGRYVVDGDNVVAIVNEYSTKTVEECDPETHRLYADIQIMIDGVENFGYTPLIHQQPSVAYDEQKDVAFYNLSPDTISYITLRPGEFIIFFPTDIHQPEVFAGQPAPVKKVVIKIRVA